MMQMWRWEAEGWGLAWPGPGRYNLLYVRCSLCAGRHSNVSVIVKTPPFNQSTRFNQSLPGVHAEEEVYDGPPGHGPAGAHALPHQAQLHHPVTQPGPRGQEHRRRQVRLQADR